GSDRGSGHQPGGPGAGGGRARHEAGPGLSRVRPGGGQHAPAAGVGEAVLPGLLPAGGGRPRRAGPDRGAAALAEPGYGPGARRPGGGPHRRRRRDDLSGLADPGAAGRGPPRVGRDGRVAGGGRAGLHPPAGPVHPGRHPGQQPARPGRGRRCHGRGLGPAAGPVRDPPPAAVVPAAAGRPDRAAAALGDRHPLPVQGRGRLLHGRGERSGVRGPRVDLPVPAAGEPEGRRSRRLFRREGGRVAGRCPAAAAADEIQL
ncbi:MAG: hypothetical protein AVDCRST_MAG41-2011, partial [uncultured Corynebacteriales bacterium]